ncbi:MAG: SEC-C metal-binding domain-containing protein [Eggerthellaceae bacterium]
MDHLVHYAIGNDYAASEYARHAPDFLDDLTSLADEVVDEGLIEKALHRMGRASAPNGRNLTATGVSCWRSTRKTRRARSSPPCCSATRSRALFELSTVVQLRNFLDARVPDGEDDFFFADRVVEALVMGAMEGAGIKICLPTCASWALTRAARTRNGCPADHERVQLAASWENNGWSPQELLERMAGKKVFYNEGRGVMKVGRNDPCPCGSGKKYKKCCGR